MKGEKNKRIDVHLCSYDISRKTEGTTKWVTVVTSVLESKDRGTGVGGRLFFPDLFFRSVYIFYQIEVFLLLSFFFKFLKNQFSITVDIQRFFFFKNNNNNTFL